MKPVKIILNRGRKGYRRMMVEMNLTKVHCKHIQKCQNETSLYK
jgi:hypothetical protein